MTEIILALFVGIFLGGTVLFGAAYYLDNYKKSEVRRRALVLASYLQENPDIMPFTAYEILENTNFTWK